MPAHGKLPPTFVPNAGQVHSSVLYYSRGSGYGIYFAREEAVFSITRQSRPNDGEGKESQRVALALQFLGADPAVRLEGQREGTAKVNYLTGSEPAKWRTGLSTYQEIAYRELWPGIDLVFRQANGQLKYEFVLQPGARVEAIRLAYRGAEGLALDAGGNLLVRTPLGALTDEKPKSYQVIEGKQVPIESRFALAPNGGDPSAYGFAVGAGYDPRYPLVIDPGLGYAALLGGTSGDFGNAIAVDGLGFAYITGETDSADFPTTAGAFDRFFGGGSKVHGISDAFVAKLDPNGAVVWATFLGGSDADVGLGIALLPGCVVDCNPYVTGFTYSGDFPVFPNPGAFRIKITGGADAFVTQLKANGSGLVYSTFLGGGGFDAGHAIALDLQGNAYITGETLSSNFPVSPFAVFASSQGKRDAFVTKLKPDGSDRVYSTYLGGNGDDVGFGIAVACLDPLASTKCNAFVTGQTASVNFPTTLSFPTKVTASIDTSLNGPTDAFVAKLKDDGSLLLYSTFLGGSGNEAGFGIAIDGAGNAYVTGQTNSTNFPTTAAPGVFQGALALNAGLATVDAFVTKVNVAGSGLVYSTFLGGTGDDAGAGITLACVDPADSTKCSAIVTGQTTSSNFPTTTMAAGALDTTYGGNTDAFVTKLKPDGSGLFYSTYLGGSGTDIGDGIAFVCTSPTDCNAYVIGQTNSHDFLPTVGPSLNLGNLLNNNADAFVAKLDVRATTSTAVASSTPGNTSVFGQPVKFTATVASPVGTPTGTVTFKDGATTLGTGTLNASGQATFTTSSLTVGTHSITAVYGGDGNFNGSTSGALTQTVNKADTLSTVTASPASPSVFGQSVTFTATVTAVLPGRGTPSGSVTFKDDLSTITCTAGGGTLASGQATCTTATLSVATHSITATYSGDGSFNTTGVGSSTAPALSYVVNKADTLSTVTALPASPSVFGQSVTFTATVTAVAPGAGTPSGSVTFKDGLAALTLSPVALDGTGKATFTTSALSVATHSITATYSGDGSFNTTGVGSSTAPALSYVVNKADTSTVVVSSKISTVFGEPVTFTATVSVVSPGAGTLTGTVQFRDNGAPLGAPVTVNGLGSVTAMVSSSSLSVGAHSITAEYSGDGNFNGSIFPGLTQTVIKASTTTAVPTSSLNPSKFGQSVTFTTTVAVVAPGTATPTGMVTFKDSGFAIGTGTLDLSGQATLTIPNATTTTPLDVGFHSITAEYNESANFFGSASPVDLDGVGLAQTVISVVTVGSITPSALFNNDCTQNVNIAGTGFLPGLAVTFSGSGITVGAVTWTSSTQISATVKVAAGTGGTQTATVTNSDGGTGTGGFVNFTTGCPQGPALAPATAPSLTVNTLPTITIPTPQGLVLTNIAISGTNLGGTPAANFVTFAGPGGIRVPATVTAASSTSLTVTVPGSAVDGPVTVAVTNATLGSLLTNAVNFDVTTPRLSVVTPGSGVQGTTVTLDVTGSNFVSPITVGFTVSTGLTVGTVTFIDTGHIQVPVAIALAAPTGLRSLTVTNPASVGSGSATLANAFEVKAPANAFKLSLPAFTDIVTYLPSVDVSVTLDATGKCTARTTLTPSPVVVRADFVPTGGALPPAQATFAITPSYIGGTATNDDGEVPTQTTAPVSAGATTILVASTACFPNSGTAVLGGTAAFDGTITGTNNVFHYTGITATSFTGVTGVTQTWPAATPVSATADFSITDALATTTTGDLAAPQQVTVNNLGGGVYQAKLWSYDRGGKVQVAVTAGATSGTITLPIDTDNDRLPDGYERDVLNQDAQLNNVLNPLNGDQNANGIPDGNDRTVTYTITTTTPTTTATTKGDGLTIYEKYRGVYQAGPINGGSGPMTGHIRLGAGKRHLFVRGRGFGNDPAITTGFCGIDPSNNFAPVLDPTLPATPCPPFEVGGAYAERGIQVHDVTLSFTALTQLPRQSLADPTKATLDMATVVYDAVNCSGFEDCTVTSKLPSTLRTWSPPTLGFSGGGTATAYGVGTKILKKSVEAYFGHKQYEHRENAVQCNGPPVTNAPCVTKAPDGTVLLTWIDFTGDNQMENAIKDNNKELLGTIGPLAGKLASDTLISGLVTLGATPLLSANDVNNDGLVELPLWGGDSRTLARGLVQLPSGDGFFPQATKRQVVRHLITHELGHAVGVLTHTTDFLDVMYQYTINWVRDTHFSQTAADLLQIHNKGLQ